MTEDRSWLDATAQLKSQLDTTRAILLDFNGTLSDDEDLLASVVRDISADELGVAISRDRYFRDFAGFTEARIFGEIAKESDNSGIDTDYLLRQFNSAYMERNHDAATISEDARTFVERANRFGKRVAVVTAASREIVAPTIDQAGLGSFIDHIVALEDVIHSKPDPACYLLALERIGVDASDALAFEDSSTGIRAARDAGLLTVGVRGSLNDDKLAQLTDFVIDELDPFLFS